MTYQTFTQGGLFPPSLKEARDFVQANLDSGVVCPCCSQLAKRYRRKLNSGMARTLIELFRQGKDAEGYVSVQALIGKLKVSPELGKLRWWGLVEDKPHVPGETRTSGLWRLTDKGETFVMGGPEAWVPRYAVVYNNELQRLEGDPVGIREALGDRFNYLELMGRAYQDKAERSRLVREDVAIGPECFGGTDDESHYMNSKQGLA